MDKEIHRIINDYKRKLEDMGIKVKRIILYGSHALGKAEEDSDIDLLVVSDSFKDMDLWERLCLLGRARIGIGRPIVLIKNIPMIETAMPNIVQINDPIGDNILYLLSGLVFFGVIYLVLYY